jgi:hypothetical protein
MKSPMPCNGLLGHEPVEQRATAALPVEVEQVRRWYSTASWQSAVAERQVGCHWTGAH